jgi:hypothetical protein
MTWNCFDFIPVNGQKVPPFSLEVCIHLECDDIQIGGQVVTFLSLCLMVLYFSWTTMRLETAGSSRCW